MPALISPCEGVRLIINEVECNHLTLVSEKDNIHLEPIDTEIDFKIDAWISEDGLTAYGRYTPAKTVKNVIVDVYPVNKLDIQVTQYVIETKKVTKDELKNYLKDAYGIIHGINDEALQNICLNNTTERLLLAEGTPTIECKDDWVEYFFEDADLKEINLQENAQGRMDYKNIKSYDTISPGKVIAVHHKGESGVDGMRINGDIIPACLPKALRVVPTYSVSYDEKTGEVKALRMGRASKMIKGDSISFHIYDSISVEDVNIGTGNIKFKGDIEVKGNVYESMEVLARHNAIIRGNVNFASVLAGNNITINGAIISSKIIAAKSDRIAKDPSALIGRIIDGIHLLIVNINSFSLKDMQEKNIQDIPGVIHFLLNSKNKDLPVIIYDVLNSLRKDNYDIEEDFIIQFIKKTRSLMGNYSEITDVQYLNNAVANLKTLFTVKDTAKVRGNVSIKSIVNSEVLALGSVIISGKGCFNTKIYADGPVIITGNLRGGQVRSEKSIKINVAGSEMGVKTLLAVPEDGTINIKTAFPDTTVKIGGASHIFLSKKQLVRARLSNGKLIL